MVTQAKEYITEILIGGGVIVSCLTLLVSRMITNLTRTRSERRESRAAADQAEIAVNTATSNVVREQAQVLEKIGIDAWERIERVEKMLSEQIGGHVAKLAVCLFDIC